MNGTLFFIFGATGDLAKRKLFPAIYSLYREGRLGERFAVVGVARRPKSNDQFREDVYQSIQEFCRFKAEKNDEWRQFAEHFVYHSLDINNLPGYIELRRLSETLDERFRLNGNRLFYLALAPELFGPVTCNLRDGGMLDSPGWHRLVIEKPFGYNLASAKMLNEQIRQVFREDQIFRIDHYLGKEMVQNIEVIRFANAFFEPLWNSKYIANVQITLSETVGVEERGGYYEKSGALRDMVQNHLLQLVAMIAMEPPSRLNPEDIRDEKVKVLRSLRRFESPRDVRRHVIRGQYTEGTAGGRTVPGYRTEVGNPHSLTETYVAARLFVDNFRWAGVPFYVRTGKRLPVKTTEVVVEFKNVPNNIYFARKNNLEPNLLVFRVQPMEGVYIKINAKRPSSEFSLLPISMDFCQNCGIGINTPEAYERLLYDAVRGDSTYFTRWDEVAEAWSFVDPIAEAWEEDAGDLAGYPAGTWGPQPDMLPAEDGFRWWPVNGQEEGEAVWVMI